MTNGELMVLSPDLAKYKISSQSHHWKGVKINYEYYDVCQSRGLFFRTELLSLLSSNTM